MNTDLNITEIFYSLQGEAREVGLPSVFIRLTGCPLRCSYCDTEYAFKGNNLMGVDAVMAKVGQYNTRYVCVTGGEPLAQITPSSYEESQNLYSNIEKLQEKDQLKFVIGSRHDFNWSVDTLKQHPTQAGVLFSPVFDQITPTQLADWIIDAQLNVRMQVQMHKLLWGDEKGK